MPSIANAVLFSLLFTVESAFLAVAGTEALAAIALVFPLFILAVMISGGAFGGAIAGTTARAVGANDPEREADVLRCTVVIAVLGSAILYLLYQWLAPVLFAWSSDVAAVREGAARYAGIVFPAIVLIWLTNGIAAIMRGSGDLYRPALVSLFMVLALAALATVLVLPHRNAPMRALDGAAWSMVGTMLVGLASCIYFFRRSRPQTPLQLRWPDRGRLGRIVRQGMLASSQSFMTIVYALVATTLFGRFGVEWLAAYGLAVRLEMIVMPLIFGVGGTLIPFCGAHLGAGQRERAIRIAWIGIGVNFLFVGSVGLLFASQPEWWCDPFASSEAVADLCAQALRIIAPAYAFFAVGLSCYIASQAMDTLWFPVAGALLRLLIVASGLWWVHTGTPATTLLVTISAAVCCYGVVVAAGLHLGPWSPHRKPAGQFID